MAIKEILSNMEFGHSFEDDHEAKAWIAKHQYNFGHYIDGKWSKTAKSKSISTLNPSDGKTLAKITLGSKTCINKAVQAAVDAQKSWSSLSCFERANYMYAIAREIQKNARLFAVLESLDNGKTIRETRDIDIPLVIRHFYHHAGWAAERDEQFTQYKELGVVGQIIPWNFPLLMLAWKIAPAMAMGNTLVLKPAEQSPLSALLFAEICMNINLPPGVINIVTGDGSTGSLIVDHPDIKKIAFTGSTDVGRVIRKQIAGTSKKLSLELGGKSPFIVFEDADLDSAVEGLVDAIWFNQGQVCCAGSRLLVHESVQEKFHKKLILRMKKLRMGSALDKNADIGAIISDKQLSTIEGFVERAKQSGVQCYQLEHNMNGNGYYFPPTLFTQVSTAEEIAEKEIFGPVLVSMSFRHHNEAVQLANNTRYGLAASIWTENINLALSVAPRIKAGTVWINSTNLFDAASGFGGYKESGFGREGGREGLFEYLRLKEELPKISNIKTAKSSPKLNDKEIRINRTAKLYIGGKQSRPDGGYSIQITDHTGKEIAEVPRANRKDVRNAVEAAKKASGWAKKTGHQRAQVLYYIAENLSSRENEFVNRIINLTGKKRQDAELEFRESLKFIYSCASRSDKNDGQVHSTLENFITLAIPEPVGTIGILCPDESPLLSFISLVLPAIAMGNTVVVAASEKAPLLATDLYQVLDTSDLPGGVINILTGRHKELAEHLARHLDMEGFWNFSSSDLSKITEVHAAENMKRTWQNRAVAYDWIKLVENNQWLEMAIRKATEIKNVWIPYGV